MTTSNIMRFITRTFIKGLVVLLPIVAAVYILTWLVQTGEAWIKNLLLYVIPERYYIPGMGLALVLGTIFCVGMLMYPWITRKILTGIDILLRKIPLFGTIYSPARDLMNVLGGDLQQELGQAVLVTLPNTSMKALGFITREDLSRLSKNSTNEGNLVVFVPWSYQLGGYCFIVPRDAVEPVNMTVEQGLRWSLTAGISMSSSYSSHSEKEEKKEKKEEASQNTSA